MPAIDKALERGVEVSGTSSGPAPIDLLAASSRLAAAADVTPGVGVVTQTDMDTLNKHVAKRTNSLQDRIDLANDAKQQG